MVRTKIKCELCGQEISKSNYSKHIRRHKNHRDTFLPSRWALDHEDLFCKYCKKEFKSRNSLCNHERLCSENPNRQIQSKFIPFCSVGHPSWNKGLTKETDSRVKEFSEALREKYKTGELTPSFKGRTHTQETKELISRKMKDYLSMNPDKVPYVINHSSRTSYPEMYFIELFKKENIDLTYHYRISKYELDFCNVAKKIDIEIDGDQHYLDKRIKISDSERDKYLISNGWVVFRIRWSEYQKSTFEERHRIIEEIRASLA